MWRPHLALPQAILAEIEFSHAACLPLKSANIRGLYLKDRSNKWKGYHNNVKLLQCHCQCPNKVKLQPIQLIQLTKLTKLNQFFWMVFFKILYCPIFCPNFWPNPGKDLIFFSRHKWIFQQISEFSYLNWCSQVFFRIFSLLNLALDYFFQ